MVTFYVVGSFGALVFALWLPVLYGSRKDRHARCLRNIARLEHELGIAENPDSPFIFKPGATWLVSDPTRVQMVRSVNHAQQIQSLMFYGER